MPRRRAMSIPAPAPISRSNQTDPLLSERTRPCFMVTGPQYSSRKLVGE